VHWYKSTRSHISYDSYLYGQIRENVEVYFHIFQGNLNNSLKVQITRSDDRSVIFVFEENPVP